MVGLAAACAGAFAAYKRDLSASYIALAWSSLTYMLHGLEFKLDKLLDLHGIAVSPEEITKDRDCSNECRWLPDRERDAVRPVAM